MSDQTFSRRWLLLSVIGMLTSFVLTVGVALFGMRGVARADQRPATPTSSAQSRQSPATFLVREIGGGPARTPTATVGTAPTLRQTDEPLRRLQRFIQNPGGSQRPTGEPSPEPETEPEPEPTVPPPTEPSYRVPAPEPPAPPAAGGSSSSGPPVARSVEPPVSVINEPVATSTPVPRLGYTATSPANTSVSVTPTVASRAANATATPTATTQSTSTPRATARAAPKPPTVSIQLSDTKIESGDTITVTVYARDDEGLDWISWEGVDAGERALDRENRYDCDGKTTCVQSWPVLVSRVGTHTLQARARDKNGLKSDPASIDLKVRRAATPTPTRTPAPTAATRR